MSEHPRVALRWTLVVLGTGMMISTGTGCGDDDLPKTAVARVGNTVITAASVDAALDEYLARTRKPVKYFAGGCQQQLTAAQSSATANVVCARERRAQEILAVKMLVRSEWVEREAARLGLRPPARTSAGTPQTAPNLKAYGVTRANVRKRERSASLDQLLAERIPISHRDAAQFYRTHKKLLMHPEQRDVRIARATSRKQALAARRALRRSQRLTRAQDVTALGHDFQLRTFYRGFTEDPALERMVYASQRGHVRGPIRTPSGWYVFQIHAIRPGLPSLKQARAEIEFVLRLQRRDIRLRRRYGEETTCAPRFQVPLVPECTRTPIRPGGIGSTGASATASVDAAP